MAVRHAADRQASIGRHAYEWFLASHAIGMTNFRTRRHGKNSASRRESEAIADVRFAVSRRSHEAI